jgi:subtilisin family serine protease
LVVIASGNGNDNIVTFGPSSSKHGLAVGQIDYVGTRSTVSNWGPNLGLVAPGEQIYSLCSKDNKHVLPSIRQNGYYKQNGTSFSTPMVAATASLVWAKNPNLTNTQVVDIILATATDMGDPGWDGMTGAGLLNASAALRSETGEYLTAMFTNVRVNRDVRDKVVSVDVYGTVRGRFKEYTLEAGKGKNASRFTPVAGPYSEQVDYQHIVRLNVQDVLRGADDWILRLKVIDNNGKEHIASTPFTLPK